MRRYVALATAFGEAQQRHDSRFGILCSLIYNRERGEDSPALQPHDFFPSLPTPKARRERSQSPEQMLAFMRTRKNYMASERA